MRKRYSYKSKSYIRQGKKQPLLGFLLSSFKKPSFRKKSSSRTLMQFRKKGRRYRGRVYSTAFNSSADNGLPWQKVRAQIMLPLLGLLILVQIYLVFFSNLFTIQHVSLNGFNLIPQESYQAVVGQLLAKKKFWVIPFNNVLLFNQQDLNHAISSNYNIEKVIIEKNIVDRTVAINIIEREPQLIYIYNDKHYFVDRDGVIINLVENEEDLQTYPLIYDSRPELITEMGPGISIGTNIMVENIKKLQNYFVQFTDLEIASYKITGSPQVVVDREVIKPDEGNDSSVIATNKDIKDEEIEAGPTEKFTLLKDNNTEFELEEITAVMTTGLEIYLGHELFYNEEKLTLKLASLSEVLPTLSDEIDDISYIDARIPNRIFYK